MSAPDDWKGLYESAFNRAEYWEQRVDELIQRLRNQVEDLTWRVADVERQLQWLKNDMRR